MTEREIIRTVCILTLQHGLRDDDRIDLDELLAEAREKAPGVTRQQICQGMRMAAQAVSTAVATRQPVRVSIAEVH